MTDTTPEKISSTSDIALQTAPSKKDNGKQTVETSNTDEVVTL